MNKIELEELAQEVANMKHYYSETRDGYENSEDKAWYYEADNCYQTILDLLSSSGVEEPDYQSLNIDDSDYFE